MKITKSQLKQIIKEELEDYRRDRNRERYGMRMTRPRRKPTESDMSDLDKEIFVLQDLLARALAMVQRSASQCLRQGTLMCLRFHVGAACWLNLAC